MDQGRPEALFQHSESICALSWLRHDSPLPVQLCFIKRASQTVYKLNCLRSGCIKRRLKLFSRLPFRLGWHRERSAYKIHIPSRDLSYLSWLGSGGSILPLRPRQGWGRGEHLTLTVSCVISMKLGTGLWLKWNYSNGSTRARINHNLAFRGVINIPHQRFVCC